VRFSKQVWPGETLTCNATVTSVDGSGDEAVVEVACEVANQDGEVKLTGTASAAVPKG
jgi:acyl dehydratase